MPTIKVNDMTGTVAIGKGSDYTVTFFDFGSFYGGETKYLYDVNPATPVLIWKGELNTIVLSSGSLNKTMNLVAYDYCLSSSVSTCAYPSNTVVVIIGEIPTSMVITDVRAEMMLTKPGVSVSWVQSIYGEITISIDDSTSEIYWGTYTAGRHEVGIFDVSSGVHKFCVSPR